MKAMRGIIFDIDGVLVRGKQVIPGAPEVLKRLRGQGLRLVCCTNENTRTAADVAAKLLELGLPIGAGDVVTAGLVAADVVAREFPGKRVLAIGGPGLLEPLQQLGAHLLSPAEAASADVLVMGRDPHFDSVKLQAACQAVWNGARFLATNYDPRVPVDHGFMPATGALVKAVAYATGVEPVILAKPSPRPAETCLAILGLPASAVVLVGDQVVQDIGMGRQAGMRTVLVLTGATTAEEAEQIPAELRPDAVLPDVGCLPGWLAEVAAV